MAQIEHRIIYYKNGKFVQYLLNIVFSLRVTKVWNQPTWFISLGGPGRDVDGEPFICDGLNLKKELKKKDLSCLFVLSLSLSITVPPSCIAALNALNAR